MAGLTVLLAGSTLWAQTSGDAMGVHNLGAGSTSPITGSSSDSCSYCHAPHSGLNRTLWNQKLTTQTYTLYSSTTERNKGRQPTLGGDSNECLSCHDGTVAVGNTVVYGQIPMTGSRNPADVFGSNLQPSHPFSLARPLKDNIDLAITVKHGKTLDPTGAVKLIDGNVECTSCHNPHVQGKDQKSLNFLVKDSSSGQLCLACHDPTRTMGSQVNPIADWTTSVHALSTATISMSASLGTYPTLTLAACTSCHGSHNGSGAARLLRAPDELDCLTCHNGGSSVSPMASYANLAPEYAKLTAHPFPTTAYPHDAAEGTLLNNNRHATCVDCHAPHSSQSVGVFTPAPLIRISQKDVAGINASDGVSALTPAVNQYENCLRCHGTSTGKQVLTTNGYLPARAVSYSDPLNLIPQFALASTSSHPVMHVGNSILGQPSLLTNMMQENGSTANPNRTLSPTAQILCTDCHNSDDNREFGGGGPNGPHGSKYYHLLERQYVYNTPTVAGGTVANLQPSPDLTANGPYALCAKCHNLSIVNSSASWSGHVNHLADGFSCSTCHTAHGMGATSGTISGERLINFDANVVASNGGLPISYNRTANSCVLVCHLAAHNTNGTVSMVSRRGGPVLKK